MDKTVTATTADTALTAEITRRRTFAIISHPDAGKTTLTERILRAGGAIQMAGNVRAKGERRRTRSDWMGIERDRGISVVTSVMTFEYGGCIFNLLDTPGHEDFSEDTYRTLTAVDAAVMVIDAAKGIEARTRKLFEICRLRDIPIVTFINKMDREAQDPFALLDEISSSLALDVSPATWPVGRAAKFVGTYDIRSRELHVSEPLDQSDPRMVQLGEELELVEAALPEFDLESFNAGHLTPVFFGSAMKEIGVTDLLDALASFGPPPRDQATETRNVRADEPALTALVFKIQANMDPNHRDRMAFARICSGKLQRGMRLKHVRIGKQFALQFARADAGKGHAVTVVGVHVGLDLEHQRGQGGFIGAHVAGLGRLVTRRRAEAGQRVQQVGHADLLHRTAEEHRGQVACVEAFQVEFRQCRLNQFQFLAQLHHARVGLVQRFAYMQFTAADIIGADEFGGAAHRPRRGRDVQCQRGRDFIQQGKRVLCLTVHLVDEGDDGNVAQAADLEQLAGPGLDALGGVDHHHGGIDRRQRAVGIFRKVFMARRVKQVEDAAAIFERHDRGHDGNAAVALDAHPVRARAPPLALGPHVARHLDGATGPQDAFGQCCLAGIRVGDDGKGAPPGNLGGQGGIGCGGGHGLVHSCGWPGGREGEAGRGQKRGRRTQGQKPPRPASRLPGSGY